MFLAKHKVVVCYILYSHMYETYRNFTTNIVKSYLSLHDPLEKVAAKIHQKEV